MKHELVTTDPGLPYKLNIIEGLGLEIPPHWHRSIEIDYTIHGQADYHVAGKTYTITDNEFIIVNSGQIHSVNNYKNISERKSIVLLIPIEVVENYNPQFLHHQFITSNCSQSALNSIKKELYAIYEARNLPDNIRKLNQHGHVLTLLSLLFIYCLADTCNRDMHDIKLQELSKKVLSYLSKYYERKLTLKSISDHFSFSAAYLSRVFKQQTGTSIMQYLQDIRLKYAYEQIQGTDLSIKEIAKLVGFSDTRSLRNKFKKKYHITPNQLRKS
ncbi:AraC-like DNA-binding protein [Lactobacillus colini]|uniref:AraC-like DNA-binding protein n=1 Tax=Lactobacillus colini TaxID=1819254 RepID=A0ABS4MEX7_9LACO|nr:AraC family transcriptional regulator [Lactobacillus colini]MBP2058237.1 AraC-like DNA-binding protein [Lactobacillus colini]